MTICIFVKITTLIKMKHLTLTTILVGLIFLFSSCGGGKQENQAKTNTKEDQSELRNFTAQSGLIIGENIPESYTIEPTRIVAAGDIRLWTMIDNDRDFYKIMEYDYAEILDPNKETKIDGLPALTNKHKYQANGDMIARTWLIWNGIDQIQITVQAPAENWDDNIAEDLISYIRITEREGEPTLPKPKEDPKHIVPTVFPEEGIMLFETHLSKDAILTTKKIENAMRFFEAMISIDSTDYANNEEIDHQAVLNQLAKENGLKDYTSFEQITMSSNAAYSLMHSFNDIMEMDKESEDYNFTYDITKSFIEQANLSYSDIRFVYDNWESVKPFVKQLEAYK
jgi:hypothetical protein